MKSICGLALTVTAALGVGCATRSVATGPEVAVTTEGPTTYLIGPSARLVVDGDRVVGRVNGGIYDVKVGSDTVAGRGPLGAIKLRLAPRKDGYRADGLWNGERVSFAITRDALRGDAFHPFSGHTRAPIDCRYDIEKLRGRASYQLYEQCTGVTDRPERFEMQGRAGAGLEDPHTATMVIAYALAPDAVR